MASCVLKSCCGCVDVLFGSAVLGFIVLVLKMLWLSLTISDIVMLTPYMFRETYLSSNMTLSYSLTVMNVVILILQIIFINMMLIGLTKNNRSYLAAYKPSIVCYVIECIIFIRIWFVQIYWKEIIILITISSDILVKILTLFFLLTVRSCYLETGDSNKTGVVYNTSRKTTKLHDSAIMIIV